MQREIKFRAFCKLDSNTPDGPLLFNMSQVDGELFFVCEKDAEIRYPFFVPFVDKDWVLQQATGFKDKSGKEVYEGDITLYEAGMGEEENVINEVAWEGNAFRLKSVDGGGWDEWMTDLADKNNVLVAERVIGNIFQNPELLK
jgi:uncharacterized phage protein (TIGR01671 family)